MLHRNHTLIPISQIVGTFSVDWSEQAVLSEKRRLKNNHHQGFDLAVLYSLVKLKERTILDCVVQFVLSVSAEKI